MHKIKDYLRKNGLDFENHRYRCAIGNIATLIAQQRGLRYTKVPDAECGKVNAYPEVLLDEVVEQAPNLEVAQVANKALRRCGVVAL